MLRFLAVLVLTSVACAQLSFSAPGSSICLTPNPLLPTWISAFCALGVHTARTSEKITRETFISPDYVKIATSSLAKYYVLGEDGESVELVDLPVSVKETGILPEGYSIDFVLDPATVVRSLAKQGIITVDQLPEDTLKEIKDVVNNAENLSIVPTSVYENKLKLVEAPPEDEDE